MKRKAKENPESSRAPVKARRPGTGSPGPLVIGAFAVGALAGATAVIGLLVIGRLNIGKPRPRRLRIGNLEIEERGDDKRFRVE